MKKKLFLNIILVFGILNSIAQPNGGFENWSTVYSLQEPDGWQTLNFIGLNPNNPLSAFKATGIDRHSGNFALKLKTVHFNENPYPAKIPDSTGGVYTGKVTTSPFTYKYGFPYSGRPEKLEFWAKYAPVGFDTAGVLVVLLKWTGTYADTVAIGGMNINATPDYAPFNCDLIYNSSELPDTAVIIFGASKNQQVARVNSTFFIDDVLFTGWNGIEKYDKYASLVKIFPNPAKDNVNINTSIDGSDNVRIVDASGKTAANYKIMHELNISTATFAAGIYIYEIRDKKNKVLSNGKFNVIK